MELAKKIGMNPFALASLVVQEKVIGVMRLYSAVRREFPPDMVVLVEALAHQGGLAIQNASMYLELENDKKSLEEDIWSHRSWF